MIKATSLYLRHLFTHLNSAIGFIGSLVSLSAGLVSMHLGSDVGLSWPQWWAIGYFCLFVAAGLAFNDMRRERDALKPREADEDIRVSAERLIGGKWNAIEQPTNLPTWLREKAAQGVVTIWARTDQNKREPLVQVPAEYWMLWQIDLMRFAWELNLPTKTQPARAGIIGGQPLYDLHVNAAQVSAHWSANRTTKGSSGPSLAESLDRLAD